MNFYRRIACIIILVATLAGCSSGGIEATEAATSGTQQTQSQSMPIQSTLQVYVFKTPAPGAISSRGLLAVLDPFSILPAPDDAVYFVPLGDSETVSGIPPIQSVGSIQAEVDEGSGEFMVTNLIPGQYVVVVRETTGSEIPARLVETDSIAIVTIEETDRGQTIDLGILRFP